MFVPVEIRASTIFGNGLFPTAPVKRGTILCSFTTNAKIITEAQYLDAIRSNDYPIVRTGTRYAGKYFTHTDDPETDLNFFNHSFTPNLLCHCGVVISLRDIAAGEEFTVDYRTLIDDTDIGVCNDAASGNVIKGFSARQTLIQTTRQLLELAESLADDWEG